MNLIQGSGGKGGSGGGGIEDDDTLRSRQYAKIIDAICEGEIQGFDGPVAQCIFLDDTPLETINTTAINPETQKNFKNVFIKYNKGTQNQAVLRGFNTGVESEQPVDTQITNDGIGPDFIVRTINATNLNRIRVTIGIPRLTVTDITNGNTHGSTVQYKIALQENGQSYVEQKLGRTEVLAPITDGISTATNAVGFTGVATVISTRSLLSKRRHTGIIRIEYKLASSGVWIVLEDREAIIDVEYEEDARYGTRHYLPALIDFYKEELALDIYNIKVTVLSGDISVSLTTCNAIRTSEIITVTGKTTSRFQKSHIIPVSGGEGGVGGSPYNVKVTRITPDATTEATQNQTFWDSYTGIVDTNLNYPNTALVGIQIDASQFKSIPKRSYLVKLKKVYVPKNYFPIERKYTRDASTGVDTGVPQIWDGAFYTAWTDNPAWCFYDLITNTRYGLGDRIPAAWVDKAALYTIAQYCDELVPSGFGAPVTVDGVYYSSIPEPRFTCNIYLQNQDEAFKVVQNMASIFRAMIYWLGGVVTPVADKPESIWAQFTNADVLDGLFTYQGSATNTRHTVALVTWNDPNERYKQKIEYVEDSDGIDRYGVNQTEVVAMGCTSRGQARRLGKWLLYTERLETEVVAFTTSLKGISLAPGKLINTFDQFRAGTRYAGRIVSSTTTSIIIDAPVIIPIGTCYVDLEMPDGSILTKTLSNPLGSTSELTWVGALTTQPNDSAIWMLTEPSLYPETWRVLGITEEADNNYVINAVSHNTSKFNFIEQEDATLTINPTSIYKNVNVVAPVTYDTNSVSDSIYKLSNNTIATKIHVSWNPSVGA